MGCENRQSVLDYVLVSEWWVDRISRFSIDDEGFLMLIVTIAYCFGMSWLGEGGKMRERERVDEGTGRSGGGEQAGKSIGKSIGRRWGRR